MSKIKVPAFLLGHGVRTFIEYTILNEKYSFRWNCYIVQFQFVDNMLFGQDS